MARFAPVTYQTYLDRIVERVVARTDLTDLEEGGVVHTLASAVARELDDLSFQMTNLMKVWDIDTAQGEDLDERGKDVNPDEITRRQESKAIGSVIFSRAGSVGLVTISDGTVVRVPDGGPEFETTAVGTIADGDTVSGAVTIQALEAGEEGNVDAGAISQMSAVSGVETVTNGAATTGGQDQETDAQYRARIKAFLRALPRGTPQALEAAALSAELDEFGRVVTAQVVELSGSDLGKVRLYIDDGAGTVSRTDDNYGSPETVVAVAAGGEVRLFLDNKPLVTGTTLTVERNAVALTEGVDFTINRATGQITLDETAFPTGLTPGDNVTAEYTWYEGLVAEVQKIVDGDESDPTNYPGYRAAGTQVFVIPPTVYQQVVTANLVVEDGFDAETVREQVVAGIGRYINGLGINGDVIFTELVHIVQSVPGVFDVTFSQPTANVVFGDGELARVTDDNIDIL